MTRSRYLVLCALLFVGAFAGGYIGNRVSPTVHAQNLILPTDIRAKSLTLVDAQGNPQATLRPSGSGAELVLNDGAGQPRVEIAASGGIKIRDARGRVIWTSPRIGLLPASE
jgi:uncharacterized protein YcfJ